MKNKNIILASQSPRRLSILKKNGITPYVFPVDINETLPDGISPKDAVMFLALKKGLEAENQLLGSFNSSNDTLSVPDAGIAGDPLILSSDTVVFKDEIMGKPKDAGDAFRMLDAIRGTWHYVATGVALIVPGKPIRKVFCEITKVHCIDYSDDEIKAYIDSGEPFDKAGGYGIQGEFGKYIDKFEGDYDTVVGLPGKRCIEEIEKLEL